MAGRLRLIQNAFTSGEVSPRMQGRTDTEYHFSGAELIENWIVLPQGGLKTRPGTRFVAEVGETALTKKVRLIPFLFNDAQAYVIEAGEAYFRFFKNTAKIPVESVSTVITNGEFTTDLSSWTAAGTGTVTWVAGQAKFTTLLGQTTKFRQAVTVAPADQAKDHTIKFHTENGKLSLWIGTAADAQNLYSSAAAAFGPGEHTVTFNPQSTSPIYVQFNVIAPAANEIMFLDHVAIVTSTPFELLSTYFSEDLFDIQYDQSADVMWLAHRAHKPRKLSRGGDKSWSFTEYTPTNDPFTNATLHPRAVALWRSRLWFAGTDAGPSEFWATKVDDFESMDPGTALDDEAINGIVAGGRINAIRSLAGLDKQLFVGTYGSEMFIRGDTAGSVTPRTVNVTPATSHGVSSLIPVKAAGFLLFLQRSKRKIRQLTFDFNSDTFIAPDLLLLADQLAEDQLVDLGYQEDPDPIIWSASSNGMLLGSTFLPSHKVLAWHRHTTPGTVESMAIIPHPDGDRDQVWFLVRRTINGVVRRFIEVFEDREGYYGQFTVDCGLHYDGRAGHSTATLILSATTIGTGRTVAASETLFVADDVGKQIWHPDGIQAGALTITGVTDGSHVTGDIVVPFSSVNVPVKWFLAVKTLTGAEHLANHPVTVIVDGATHTGQTVSAGGTITLESWAGQAEAGLKFTPRIISNRPEARQAGTIQGLAVSRSNLKVRVLDTVTLTINDQVLPDRSSEDYMDKVPPLFSGDLDVIVLGWEDDAKVEIVQDTSQPATILALMSNVVFGDE